MKKIRLYIKALFGFSQKEINGFIILTVIMVTMVAAPFFLPLFHDNQDNFSSVDAQLLDEKLKTISSSTYQEMEESYIDSLKTPVRKKQKYQQRDKSYPKKFEQKKYKNQEFRKKDSTQFKRKIYTKIPININTATAEEYKTLRGIGEKTAARILKFREALGGFYSVKQLYEVSYIDSNAITTNLDVLFMEDNFIPQMLNINEASMVELSKHPYISHKQASVLVNYRTLHGKFKTPADLLKTKVFTEQDLEKLKFYLKAE